MPIKKADVKAFYFHFFQALIVNHHPHINNHLGILGLAT